MAIITMALSHLLTIESAFTIVFVHIEWKLIPLYFQSWSIGIPLTADAHPRVFAYHHP